MSTHTTFFRGPAVRAPRCKGLSRRNLARLGVGAVLGIGGGSLARRAFAAEPLVLEWEQLMPKEELDAILSGLVPPPVNPHDPYAQSLPEPEAPAVEIGRVVYDFDGQFVRLPGFMIPLEFEGNDLFSFLLVPYFGACIHVPPPPPNQVVMASSEKGVELGGMFDAIWVTGTFRTVKTQSVYAEAGYHIDVAQIEAYEF